MLAAQVLFFQTVIRLLSHANLFTGQESGGGEQVLSAEVLGRLPLALLVAAERTGQLDAIVRSAVVGVLEHGHLHGEVGFGEDRQPLGRSLLRPVLRSCRHAVGSFANNHIQKR